MTAPKNLLAILVPAAALLAAGCGPRQMYSWHGYDDALYAHYKNPQDHAKHIERMQKIVTETEAAGVKMPPGVYAEYGYALVEEGRFDESLTCFRKEKETWPESAVLMDKLARNVARLRETGRKAPGGTGDASPAAGGPGR